MLGLKMLDQALPPQTYHVDDIMGGPGKDMPDNAFNGAARALGGALLQRAIMDHPEGSPNLLGPITQTRSILGALTTEAEKSAAQAAAVHFGKTFNAQSPTPDQLSYIRAQRDAAINRGINATLGALQPKAPPPPPQAGPAGLVARTNAVDNAPDSTSNDEAEDTRANARLAQSKDAPAPAPFVPAAGGSPGGMDLEEAAAPAPASGGLAIASMGPVQLRVLLNSPRISAATKAAAQARLNQLQGEMQKRGEQTYQMFPG